MALTPIDPSDKLYTREDMVNCFNASRQMMLNHSFYRDYEDYEKRAKLLKKNRVKIFLEKQIIELKKNYEDEHRACNYSNMWYDSLKEEYKKLYESADKMHQWCDVYKTDFIKSPDNVIEPILKEFKKLSKKAKSILGIK